MTDGPEARPAHAHTIAREVRHGLQALTLMHSIVPLVAVLTAAVASWLATHGVVRLAASRGWASRPDDHHVHVGPVPRLGGIAIVAGATVGLLAAVVINREALAAGGFRPPVVMLGGLIAGGGIVFGAGLIDDVRGLRPVAKLAAQVAAALVVWELGFRIDVLSAGTGSVALGWASLPVTLLWIVGVTNAYNLVDGMDGLATGLGIIAFAAIAAAAGLLGHAEVVVVAAALLGALLGFLPHNFSPARIFLGDSGSLFLGFVLAVLSVQGSMKSATAVIVAVPLLALFIPLLDTVVAILRRWIRGMPIMEADGRHIHHRLAAVGFRHRDAVLLLYLVGAGFAGLGILLGFAPAPHLALVAAAGGAASALVIVVGMRRLQYDEFLLAGKVLASGPLRMRRAIRDRIVAEEVARKIERAESLEEIQGLLTAAAPQFGLMELKLAGGDEARVATNGGGVTTNGAGAKTNGATGNGVSAPGRACWTLDHPLPATGGRLRLRLVGPAEQDYRTRIGERAVHLLLDTIDGRAVELRPGGSERPGPRLQEEPDPAPGVLSA